MCVRVRAKHISLPGRRVPSARPTTTAVAAAIKCALACVVCLHQRDFIFIFGSTANLSFLYVHALA